MKSVLRFIDYVIDEIYFKNEYNNEESFELDFEIDSNVEFDDANNFVLKLNTHIFQKQENAPFRMNVKIIGIFEIDDVEDNLRLEIAEKNAVAILFPYVRALISNYTAVANVSPLILPPINVTQYLKDKKKRISET
ncbi:protein-export chaperone SecB [Clostridium sp. UBA5712]|uniref:protein-export chaperone SecB n=1 Tax=Clostridium sp. UBA5712 TaxID=1946368 RepID=UPI0032171F1E